MALQSGETTQNVRRSIAFNRGVGNFRKIPGMIYVQKIFGRKHQKKQTGLCDHLKTLIG